MQVRSFHFIVAMVAGWLGREQEAVIEYLKEENKVLREQMGSPRLRFTDSQRPRLAVQTSMPMPSDSCFRSRASV